MAPSPSSQSSDGLSVFGSDVFRNVPRNFFTVREVILESIGEDGEEQTAILHTDSFHPQSQRRLIIGATSMSTEMDDRKSALSISSSKRICDMGNPERLFLRGFWAAESVTLHPSIGRCKSLKRLICHCMGLELSELPEEIGDLTNLEQLVLQNSTIRSLPASIGKLQKLKLLDLTHCKNLSDLPREIGDMVGLEKLILDGSTLQAVPWSSMSSSSSTSTLPSLKHIWIVEDDEVHPVSFEALVVMAQRCKSLGCISTRGTLEDSFSREEKQTISHLLAGNRARSQLKRLFRPADTTTTIPTTAPTVWPLALTNARRASCPRLWEGGSGSGAPDLNAFRGHVSEPDAIHQFLAVGRGSFLQVVADRANRPEPGATSD